MLRFLLFLPSFFFFQNTFAQFKASFGDISARSIGPAVMSGRIADVQGVNNQPTTIYLGTANGGVWKSDNAGATFRPIFEEYTQSIGAIAVDQQHPDTIWVGTGEPWVRNSVSVGDGVYVSTNGGTSWTHSGLKDSERISGMIVHPENSSIIYVAVQGHLWNGNEERGVYKSSDFGTTWERVLYVDENTGAADISMDANNPEVLYVTMWEHRRSADYFNSGGESSGVYKTMDGGKNWTKLTNGLPEGKLGRMAVAVAPSNSDVVYLTVEAEKKADKGLYRSNDAGKNWKLVNSDFGTTVRPFYFSRIVVDPKNEDKIFKAGLSLTASENGGDAFRTIGSGVHSDVHDIWINPKNTDNVYIGTDGGGYRSLDGGRMFEMFMNLPLSQFYHVTVDDAEPFHIYGGLQDNGSWYAPSKSPGGIENKDWQIVNWGDGFRVYRHRTDENIIYAESQGGNIVRYDRKDGQRKDIKPLNKKGEPEYRFNWNTPIQLSPTNDERLYVGAQFLFVSEDRGDTWTKISPDLTTNNPNKQRQAKSGGLSIDNSTAENNTTIYTIAESPKDEKVIWVGTDDGNVQVTQDGGKTWTNTVGNMPDLPAGLWVAHVEASRFDRNTAYVTIDGHKSGEKAAYVFKTNDLGKTWTSLVTEEVEGYAHAIIEDSENEDLLFLGTEFGLYISLDQGTSWKRFENGMPNKVGVRMMAIQPRESALVVATHGRGIYVIEGIDILRQVTPEIAGETLAFLDTKDAYFRYFQLSDPFGGAGNFTGANPDNSAKVAYYMRKRHTFGKMSAQLYDSEGNFIKELSAGKSAGINVVSIPISLPLPKSAPTMNRMALGGSLTPPTLPEGTYTLKIKKGKQTYETTFNLMADPKTQYSAADRKMGHETQMQLYHMTEQLAYIYDGLTDMHNQAEELRNQVKKKKLAEQLNYFKTSTQKLKESLVALEGDFYVDESSSLREDISTLALGVSGYPGKPTNGQLEKLVELKDRLEEVQQQFDKFEAELQNINEQLQKRELETIELKTFEEFKVK
ncbi:MAG: hypothetical protein AAGG68_07700 [Bacteroidota bacterium]